MIKLYYVAGFFLVSHQFVQKFIVLSKKKLLQLFINKVPFCGRFVLLVTPNSACATLGTSASAAVAGPVEIFKHAPNGMPMLQVPPQVCQLAKQWLARQWQVQSVCQGAVAPNGAPNATTDAGRPALGASAGNQENTSTLPCSI